MYRCMACVHRFHGAAPRNALFDNPLVAAIGGSTLVLMVAVVVILWLWKN